MFSRTRAALPVVLMLVAPFAGLASAADGPTVLAAASMKTALDKIAVAWKAKTGRMPIVSYGSSGTMARQIENGAPGDVFISADLKWMDVLDKEGLIAAGTRRNLLGNTLVLVEPATFATRLTIAKGFDLAGAVGDGKLAVCTVTSCPGGMYGKESLESLGVWTALEPKLAQADNVRAALLVVARGEARFGIVYGTDARAEPRVRVVDVFPEASHSPVIYPVARLRSSTDPDAAAFEAFLSQGEASSILQGQGFELLH